MIYEKDITKEGFIDDFCKTFKFSKSSLNFLFQCPLGFYYQYIEKVSIIPNKYFMKGTEIHSMIQQYNKGSLDVSKVKRHKKHIQNYIKFLDYYKLPLPIMADDKRIKTEVNGFKLTAQIDSIYKKWDNYLLVDYKTGYPKYDLRDYLFELKFYCLMMEKVENIRINSYGILFTDNGSFLWELNDGKYDIIYDKLEKIKDQLKKLDEGLVSENCCFCNVYNSCKVFRGSFYIVDSSL